MITDVGGIEELTKSATNLENVVWFTVSAASCMTQNINVYPDTLR